MIVIDHTVPVSALTPEILEAVKKHFPRPDEHALIILPHISSGIPVIMNGKIASSSFQIAATYEHSDMGEVLSMSIAATIRREFGGLSNRIRVPYQLFICGDDFHRQHKHILARGTTAHTLVKKLTRK